MVISNYLRDEHRSCDGYFAECEEAVNSSDFKKALEYFEKFMDETLKHFDKEEQILFLEFENVTGNTEGPTRVMRYEHEQVRRLLDDLKSALGSEDKDRFFSVADTLMILLQQHNMKEEQMLYAMCDQVLGKKAEEIVDRMRSI